jgi:SAM-dependent methyltransferase
MMESIAFTVVYVFLSTLNWAQQSTLTFELLVCGIQELGLFATWKGTSMSSREMVKHRLGQLVDTEKASTCGQASRLNYLDMHQARFADILRLCQSHVPDPLARVLDVGRSELTAYLLNYYNNIHTMGLDTSMDDGGHREVTEMDTVAHITFDLLNSHIPSSWPECESFDLIVFSEVLEHLCVAPEFVFAALGSLLAEGGVLICSTPNAASFAKRVHLALGRNPYERLRLYALNPGHIREYTQQELYEIAESVGLRCKRQAYFNWIQKRRVNPLKAAVMKLVRAYPPFRSFQVCVLTKK